MVSTDGIEGDQGMTYGGHRAGPRGQVRQISRGGGQDTLWGEHGQRSRDGCARPQGGQSFMCLRSVYSHTLSRTFHVPPQPF